MPSPSLEPVDDTHVIYRNKKLIYFGGCSYLRLTSHPKVIAATQSGLTQYGLNVAASRLTTGNHRLYLELEKKIAHFFDVDAAIFIANGYISNIVVAQALIGLFSHVLIDEKAHSSLKDASLFFGCPVIPFKHHQPQDAAAILQGLGKGVRPILLTEGLHLHSGEIAPIQKYLELLPKNGKLLIDDAHGTGILGKNGKGTIEELGISSPKIIQTVTFSKGFGVYGAAVLGSSELRSQIHKHSQLFAGSTPLPLPLVSALLASLKLVTNDRARRQRLHRNIAYTKSALRDMGIPTSACPTPIIGVTPASKLQIAPQRRRLLANMIYPLFVTNYPGSPANGYFRFTLSSEHNQEQLDTLLRAVRR